MNQGAVASYITVRTEAGVVLCGYLRIHDHGDDGAMVSLAPTNGDPPVALEVAPGEAFVDVVQRLGRQEARLAHRLFQLQPAREAILYG